MRPDADHLRAINREPRSDERLRAHYDVERGLADRLRAASPAERPRLYGTLYGELFAAVTDHPQHRLNPVKRRDNADAQTLFLRRFCDASTVFVEIGCGDGMVAAMVAAFTERSIGIDVTPMLHDAVGASANFEFRLSDGIALPLEDHAATLVFSNQLIEHLHPDDTRAHLAEVLRILRPGGRYLCTTPNRLTGPHDISGYFDRQPTGFHLVEYGHGSLASLLADSGFVHVRGILRARGHVVDMPAAALGRAERLIGRLPGALGARLLRIGALRNLAGIMMTASKPKPA